ncbi:MAG: BcpO-related WXXGXW repeat protein [Steroidobacteraceae bacterium]|nr:BcpO-related WXXGXW repeat protein [Steroidobacteraceae bacterium]
MAGLLTATSLLGACVVGTPYYSPNPGYASPATQVDLSAGSGGTQIYVQATVPPPPLPVYVQPPCPAQGYLWTPGYWAYGGDGYFWVPGTWVMPPQVGVLWTPGYWGWSQGLYVFHAGYWGPRVGFYGHINYGGGYLGVGFVGGRWDRDQFEYNRAVMNVDRREVHNVYYNRTVINNTVINNTVINRVSYVGGPGGLRAAPTRVERMAAREPHITRTPMQRQQVRAASMDRAQFARYNGGRPPIAATPRPRAFASPQAVPARGAIVPRPGARFGQGQHFTRPAPGGYPIGPAARAQARTFPLHAPPARSFAAPQRPYAAPQRPYALPPRRFVAPQRRYVAPRRPAPVRAAPARARPVQRGAVRHPPRRRGGGRG